MKIYTVMLKEPSAVENDVTWIKGKIDNLATKEDVASLKISTTEDLGTVNIELAKIPGRISATEAKLYHVLIGILVAVIGVLGVALIRLFLS